MPSDAGRDLGVGAVILAAGTSSRMGRNKLLLQAGGRSLLRRAVQTAEAAGLCPRVVVTGAAHDEIATELQPVDCRLVLNESYAEGMHTSIGVGVGVLEPRAASACCDPEVGAAVVMLADMPWVDEAMLRSMVDVWRRGAGLVVSRYGGEVEAPPMLYGRDLFEELCVMERRCGKEVIRRHRGEVVFADWPATALQDVDTPQDYARLRAQIASMAHAT